MRKQPLSLTGDPEIRATFQAQLAEARATPALSGLVTRPAPDLYPRYSDYYRQLCQLPRRVRRGLQRQWKRSLSTLALLLALGQAPALAATIHVDGTSCTLADAIRSANTNTAVGGCTKGSGADTLVLAPKSTHTLTTVEDTTYGDTGLPLVTSTITVAGNRSTIERGAGAPKFRLMAVSRTGKLALEKLTLRGGYAYGYFPNNGGGGVFNGGTLTLTNTTVSGNTGGFSGGVHNDGTLSLTNSTVSGNKAQYLGGGVFNRYGTLTLTNSTVSGNSAMPYGNGGGVFNSRYSILTFENSTVSGNSARGGGGMVNDDGTLTLRNSTVSDNMASYGGGVFNGGTLALTNSTVSGNTASDPRPGYGGAGGVLNFGTATLKNSTVSGNTANDGGGGMVNIDTLTLTNSTVSDNMASNGGGGGMVNIDTLTLTNTTVSGNTATAGPGGGVINYGILTLTNSTISGNTANSEGGGVSHRYGTLTLGRSLVTGNKSPIGSEAFNFTSPYGSSTVAANNFNLFGHNGNAGVVGFSPGPTDIVPTVSLSRILEPLAANGGPTLTRALVSGSPAIDAVRARCPPPATDQRGVRRPKGPACDIGAFEFDPRGVCASVRPSKGCTVNGVPNRLCRGTADHDTIVGTSRNDVILGRRGSDVLSGLAGHDLLCGQQDNDLIRGGAAGDNIEGNDGEDELFGDLGNDWIKGGKGNDFLDGGSGKDRLDGQQGTDTCVNGESVRSCP